MILSYFGLNKVENVTALTWSLAHSRYSQNVTLCARLTFYFI